MSVAVGVLVLVCAIAWLGLQVAPRPFAPPTLSQGAVETTPLPDGLPGPVERFYRATYGERVPVISSVVVTGRARLRPFGIWLPARYRFIHDAGRGYRHYIEATWFGIPFLKVNERYIDGVARMELPWGTEQGAKVDQAANVGMWAEIAGAAPSVLVTDARVRWRPLDAESALLVVPRGAHGSDTFVVRFDVKQGRIALLEAMRYRDSRGPERILWLAANEAGRTVGPWRLPAVGSATWLDQGRPWAVFTAEDLRCNVDVRPVLRMTGP
jgi:hypothetical protein